MRAILRSTAVPVRGPAREAGDQATSLGLVPNDGSTAFASDLADADAVAVSIEPAGGSDQPTTEPVLVMSLR